VGEHFTYHVFLVLIYDSKTGHRCTVVLVFNSMDGCKAQWRSKPEPSHFGPTFALGFPGFSSRVPPLLIFTWCDRKTARRFNTDLGGGGLLCSCLCSGGEHYGGVRFASCKEARSRFDWTLNLWNCHQCCHSYRCCYRYRYHY